MGTMTNYFDLLEDTLKKYDLLHFPAQIYNIDEIYSCSTYTTYGCSTSTDG